MKENIYEVGQIIQGTVTGIENYGIFMSFDNNYTGLIHISEITESYVRNIRDYVSDNEELKVKILEIDENHKHLKLSVKDIKDYRFTKKDYGQIIETKKGFKSLGKELDKWIDKKINEIDKEQKK